MARLNRAKIKVKLLEDVIEDYLDVCKQKNLSPTSIKVYKYDLYRFNKHISIRDVKDLNQDVLNEYISVIDNTFNYNEISFNSLGRNLNLFFSYCFKENLISQPLKLTYKKVNKKIKDIPTNEQIKMLLRKPNYDTAPVNEIMAYVVINIVCATGLRIGSIANIHKSDIDFKNNTIKIRITKSREEKVIHVTKRLKLVLREYTEMLPDDSDLLWNDRFNTPMSSGALGQAVRNYGKARNIHVSPHLLRHWFAQEYMKNGGDVYSLSRLLFHKNVSITEIYLQSLNIQDFNHKLERFNPMDNLK